MVHRHLTTPSDSCDARHVLSNVLPNRWHPQEELRPGRSISAQTAASIGTPSSDRRVGGARHQHPRAVREAAPATLPRFASTSTVRPSAADVVNARTSSEPASYQVRDPRPSRSSRRSESSCRYSSSVEPSTPRWRSTASAPYSAGCGQPRLGARAEPERRRAALPRHRHPAAVAAALSVVRAFPGRVLADVVGQPGRLREAELLALVEVRRPGQRRASRWWPRGPAAGRARRPAAGRRRRCRAAAAARASARSRAGSRAGRRRGWTAPRSAALRRPRRRRARR